MNKNRLTHSLLRILLTLFFFLLSLGQIQRFQLTPQIAVYMHEVVLGGMILISGREIVNFYSNFIPRIRRKKWLSYFIIFFFVQTFLYQIWHFDLLALSYLLRLILYAQLFPITWLAVHNLVFTKKQIYMLLVGMSILIAVLGFFQYLLFPDTRWLLAMGWDDHYYRLISTLFDPGFTGLIIAAGLVIYLKVFTQKNNLINDSLTGLFFMLAILLTYSRATYLAIGVVLLFNVIFAKKRVLYFIIFCSFALIPFLPRPTGEGVRLERTASITSRITSNHQALGSLSLTKVIWGRGLYRDIVPAGSDLPSHAGVPDNSFIFLFVSLGVSGVALGISALWELRRWLLREPLLSLLILIGVHSMINNSLFYIWTIVILSTVLGVSYKLRLK